MRNTPRQVQGIAPSPPAVPSVAVLVELLRNDASGGHMKCWERFAEAAADRRDGEAGIDLTVYVLGHREHVEELSPRVRFVALRPVLSTAAAMPVVGGVDITDLAPHHPRLARLLPRHDVWHLTHSFAFAATAVRLAGAASVAPRPGLVASLHTDVPALASVYTRQVVGKVPGLSRLADGPAAGLPHLVEELARHRRDRLLRRCDRVLASSPHAREEMHAIMDPARVSLLRRGVDHERFRPDPAAREELVRRHRIPGDRPLVLFVGRVDASKGAPLLAEAIRRLLHRRLCAHLVIVGAGAETDHITRLLGPDVTHLGRQPQDRLAQVYAGCDVFAFPSHTETVGNVVAEAMACGLPVVLPERAETTQWLAAPGHDGLVVRKDTPAGWARALEGLLVRPDARRLMGRRAARTARTRHPTWARVLEEDLLPVWQEVAGTGRRAGAHPSPSGAH
ncbi:glycosyltransferase [Streptomyces viridochromogenes]|uniref:Putative Glycosyl transferase, group 1 family protein n=1 Tax=Streptomyces viridochromogenes Tue57 TaxID=1160705 RepID=L8P7V2_STRVR|nr:glycosyltransferase [Streptomyces viridochromogenes]ELS51387.1 putative Glycosyl transferase, group 1 family protein [Streptomyces viridochromogenes Tue57]